MQKKWKQKILAVLLVITYVSGILRQPSPGHAIHANAPTAWVYSSPDWRYYDANGRAVTGWYLENGSWYYFSPESAVMQTGWLHDGNKWYYLNPSSGIMQTAWLSDGGQRYYLLASGAMAEGWLLIDNRWYYFDPASGCMHRGWLLDRGKWYYLADSGAMEEGWRLENGRWYYLSPGSGAMKTGRLDQGEETYYFDPSGAMAEGWRLIDGKWYFYKPGSGTMHHGWLEDAALWYYLRPENGQMISGTTQIIGDMQCSFRRNGSAIDRGEGWKLNEENKWVYGIKGKGLFIGWIYYNNALYYVEPEMVANAKRSIGSVEYKFLSDGRLESSMNSLPPDLEIAGESAYRWIQMNNESYCYDSNGHLLKGLQIVGENTYLFDASNGRLLHGLQSVGSDIYYFQTENGQMLKDSWLQLEGHHYFFDTNGHAVKGMQNVRGNRYIFDTLSAQRLYGNINYEGLDYYCAEPHGLVQRISPQKTLEWKAAYIPDGVRRISKMSLLRMSDFLLTGGVYSWGGKIFGMDNPITVNVHRSLDCSGFVGALIYATSNSLEDMTASTGSYSNVGQTDGVTIGYNTMDQIPYLDHLVAQGQASVYYDMEGAQSGDILFTARNISTDHGRVPLNPFPGVWANTGVYYPSFFDYLARYAATHVVMYFENTLASSTNPSAEPMIAEYSMKQVNGELVSWVGYQTASVIQVRANGSAPSSEQGYSLYRRYRLHIVQDDAILRKLPIMALAQSAPEIVTTKEAAKMPESAMPTKTAAATEAAVKKSTADKTVVEKSPVEKSAVVDKPALVNKTPADKTLADKPALVDNPPADKTLADKSTAVEVNPVVQNQAESEPSKQKESLLFDIKIRRQDVLLYGEICIENELNIINTDEKPEDQASYQLLYTAYPSLDTKGSDIVYQGREIKPNDIVIDALTIARDATLELKDLPLGSYALLNVKASSAYKRNEEALRFTALCEAQTEPYAIQIRQDYGNEGQPFAELNKAVEQVNHLIISKQGVRALLPLYASKNQAEAGILFTYERPSMAYIELFRAAEDETAATGDATKLPEEGTVFRVTDQYGKEVDQIVINHEGWAVSKLLPAAVYTLTQDKNSLQPGFEVMEAFQVAITEDGQALRCEIKNKPLSAVVEIDTTPTTEEADAAPPTETDSAGST